MNGEGSMNVRRHFFSLSMLAAAVAPPAFGQEVLPAAGIAGGDTQNAATIPDFSGIWAHPYFPGFEPPASGPGPIVNKSRLRGGPRDGVGNANQFVGDYANPILRLQAAEVVRRHGEISLAGATYPTPSNQCWPSGVPYIFSNTACKCCSCRKRSFSSIYAIMNFVRCD
jgi:hypothetical protein